MSTKRRYTTVFLLCLAVVAADQASKHLAIHYLRDTDAAYRFAYNLFVLVYAENKGAFLGLGAGLPPGLRQMVMIGANAVILSCLAIYLLKAGHLSAFMTTALSFIMAGGIGNLIDRVFRGGAVVDFMNIGITVENFSLRTGIFNIADVAIMAGLFMVVIHELMLYREERKRALCDNTKSKSTPPKK